MNDTFEIRFSDRYALVIAPLEDEETLVNTMKKYGVSSPSTPFLSEHSFSQAHVKTGREENHRNRTRRVADRNRIFVLGLHLKLFPFCIAFALKYLNFRGNWF